MATVNKDFRVKSGLVVEGANATVNGSQVLTEASTEFLQDVIGTALTGGTQTNISVTYDDVNGVINLTAENGVADSTTDNLVEGATNKYFTDERAQDAMAAAFAAGTHTNITVTYDDAANSISLNATGGVASLTGTTGEVEVTNVGTAFTVGLPDDVSITNDLNVGGDLVVAGNLTVDGTVTAINSTTITVDDKNLELAAVDTPTDVTADGAGITVKGTTDKTWNWVDATDAWTSSEHIDIPTGKAFKINNVDIKDVTETLTNKTISGASNTLTNIGNASLTNSSITINGKSTALGSSVTLSTTDVGEGTNLYFTDERAQDAVGNAIGTGLAYNDETGAISNTGVLSIAGTTDQIAASGSTGNITLSLPQSIATTSSPTFASLTVSNGIDVAHVELPDGAVGSSAATVGTSVAPVDSWSATAYSSAKYFIQMKNGLDIHTLEALVMIDGNNNVYITEYAEMISNASLGTVDADFSAGNVRLLVTAEAASTSVKVHRTLLGA